MDLINYYYYFLFISVIINIIIVQIRFYFCVVFACLMIIFDISRVVQYFLFYPFWRIFSNLSIS